MAVQINLNEGDEGALYDIIDVKIYEKYSNVEKHETKLDEIRFVAYYKSEFAC